uniref:Si:ch211-1e14.1 n=1 Tax=Oncorhynchus kisutch TaxID=8019 RepID=A0A8C7FSI0_ONCKI
MIWKKGYIEGDHTSNTCILQLVVSTGMHHKWIKCHDFHAMEGLRFSMGSLVISKTVLPIQGFGAAVLGVMLLVTMITAGSPAAVDWPSLDPTMLEEFQEEVPSWTESPSALLVSHTDASEHLDDTTTIALLSPGPLPLESPSRSSDPLSTPPFSSSEPAIVLQKHPEGPARLSRDMKLSGPISTMAATSSTLVTVPHQKLLGPQSNISTTPLNFSTATSGTTSPQFIVPNSNERASDEPPLLPPSNQQDPSKQRTPALMTSLPVGPLNLPRLPVDNLVDVAALSDQASPESRPNPDVSQSLGDLSLDHKLPLEPSSRLIDLDHLRPSSELMQKDHAAQGIYMLLKPSPEMQLAPSYVPFLSPQTTSSSAEPTMVPTEDFFPTNTMEMDWGSGDHPETVSYMGSEGDDFSLVTNLPTDMYDLEDSNAERYDTSFPSRVGVSFSSMRHVTSTLSLTTTDLSSGVRSVAPTSVPPSIHPYPSHSMLASTPTPQGSLPEGSGVDWTDTFTVEPTDLLLPDMNSLEYYTVQLTKDDSEEHRGTNVTTTSRHFSLMSISTIHIMATSTFTEDPSYMLTASYGVEVQPSDNTTWIKESSDISGAEPLNTTTADATEMTSLNFSVPFLEPSLAPTPSMDLSTSLWGVTGQVSSGEWISPVATSSVGMDSSSVLVSVQPSAMASETDIQWYVSPIATETALLSTSLVTPVLTTSVAFTPVPGQTELPPDVTSGPTERATNATTFPPVSVMADQGIDTDSPVTAGTNVSQSTLSTVDTPSTTDPATTTTTTTTITTKASTTTALATTTTTTTPLNITTTKSLPTTIGRQYLCNVSKPVYFVKVGFPPGATVGYAKSQIRDILKTEFNKSIELQVAKSPPDFVFRAVSGPVVFTAISVINALRQSGRRFQPISHYWKVPDHQYQVHSVLQFVPSHVDVRVCNFSERIEKGLTMAYGEVRRRAQESTNFTVHIVNITMNQPRSQQREPVDVTFAVRDAVGYLKGSEVSNHLRLLNMVEFSYYLGFPVLQIAEPFHYPELNTTQLLRSSWVRTVMLGVLDQGVDGRTFQAKMERRVALLLGEVLRAARRNKRATSVANHSVQIVSTTRLVGADHPLDMVYFVDQLGQRLPAITTANMLNRLDVQRAAIVLGYRVQGILATPVEKVAGYPPPDTENTSMWIIIGVVVPLGVVIVIISILYWKLCRTDKLEFQPDAMTTVQQRQKLQAPSVKGFDFAKLHLGQHSKDDIMVIQEPGAPGPPPPISNTKESAATSKNGEVPTPRSKGTSVSSTKASRSTRRRGRDRISPSDRDSMVSAGSGDREKELAEENLRAFAMPNDSKQARKIPINVLNGNNRIGPPPMNGHDEHLSSASIFEHVDRMSRSADGTRRLSNKIQLIAMQPMAVPPQHHSPTVNGINGRGPETHSSFNKEIQVALRHKSEIEHHRNKIRLRAKRKGHYDFPAMDDLVDNGLTTDPKDQDHIYHKAQMQIDKILNPDIHMPSLFMEPKKSGRGRRSPKQRKKHQLNGSLTDADKDRLISNDSDGTYRKYPGVNNVAYVSDPDQAPESGTPSPNDDVFLGPISPPPGHAPPPPPYMPPQPSIEEARQQMHSLLDNAFALVSPTSQGSTAGITLPGVNSNPPSSSPPPRGGARPWGTTYPALSPFSSRYAELGMSPPSLQGLLQRQGLGSNYPPGDPGHVDQLPPESHYSTRGLYTEDLPSSTRPRPVGGTTGNQLNHLNQVDLGSRIKGGYPLGGRAPPGQTGGSGWAPYSDGDFRPTRDPVLLGYPDSSSSMFQMPSRSSLREPSAHLDIYPPEESSPPNHSSASLIKAIREELLRLSQKQQAVPSYHS